MLPISKDIQKRDEMTANGVADIYQASSKLAKYPFEPYWPEKKLKICVTGAGGFIARYIVYFVCFLCSLSEMCDSWKSSVEGNFIFMHTSNIGALTFRNDAMMNQNVLLYMWMVKLGANLGDGDNLRRLPTSLQTSGWMACMLLARL